MPAKLERRTVLVTANLAGGVRRETLEGRTHLVVNGAILGEDVLNGSNGPIYYPKEENAKDVESWNHIPIVLYHPKEGGQFVTARRPDVVNSRKIGLLFNTRHEDGKVKPEFWFDEERTKTVDERVYNAIEAGKPVEVSTGLSMDFDPTPGEFNGKKYVGIARNYKPDHLAVLPDQVGAYSVAMGGGLFANQDLSFSDTTCQINDLLAAKYGDPGQYWRGYVLDVYDGYVIFRKAGDDYRKMYMIGYTTKDGVVSLAGEEQEVEQQTEYKVVNGATYEVRNGVLSQKEVPVSQSATFDKKAHVTALIGNGQIKEADRAKYEALPDDVVQGIAVVKKEEPAPAPAVVPAPAPVANQQPLVVNLNNLDPAIRRQVERGLAAEKREKDGHIIVITANVNNSFTKEYLESKDVDELAALAKLARGAEDQAGDGRFLPGTGPGFWGPAAGGVPVVGNAGPDLDEPLVMPDPFAAKK